MKSLRKFKINLSNTQIIRKIQQLDQTLLIFKRIRKILNKKIWPSMWSMTWRKYMRRIFWKNLSLLNSNKTKVIPLVWLRNRPWLKIKVKYQRTWNTWMILLMNHNPKIFHPNKLSFIYFYNLLFFKKIKFISKTSFHVRLIYLINMDILVDWIFLRTLKIYYEI